MVFFGIHSCSEGVTSSCFAVTFVRSCRYVEIQSSLCVRSWRLDIGFVGCRLPCFCIVKKGETTSWMGKLSSWFSLSQGNVELLIELLKFSVFGFIILSLVLMLVWCKPVSVLLERVYRVAAFRVIFESLNFSLFVSIEIFLVSVWPLNLLSVWPLNLPSSLIFV